MSEARYVVVGEELGIAEEYLGDPSTTYIENGKIHAAISGNLTIDQEKRKILIDGNHERKRKIPRKGDIVTGTIYSIRKSSVGIKIKTVNNLVAVDVGLIGNIHVSKVSNSYVDKLDDIFDKNDLVRARVVRINGREYQISTSDDQFGVIKASCKYCGHDMIRKGNNQVACHFCNNHQRKKMANDYGSIEEILKF
ncbi:MAG: exosome complex RNA-binding protein Csl4 [Promethearchaeota archaeon]